MKADQCEKEELLKAIEALKKENDMYQLIFETFPVNVFVKDRDCKYQLTNRVCDMVNGVGRGELKGKTDFELQDCEDIAQIFYDDDQEIMVSKKGSRMLSPTLCGTDIHYFDIYKEPLIDADDEVVGILGMVIDPRQIPQNELPFIQYPETFHYADSVIFDYELKTGKIIILVGIDGLDGLREIRKNFEQEMVASGRIAVEDKAVFLKQFQKVKNHETQCISMFRLRDDNGQWRYCALSLTPVFERDMTLLRAIGVLSVMDEETHKIRELNLAVGEVRKHFSSIIRKRFETIIYINPAIAWYQIVENNIPGLSMAGPLGELSEFYQVNMHDDGEEISKYLAEERDFESVFGRSGKDVGDVYATFEKTILVEGEPRWNEIEIFPIPALDGKAIDFVITISDVDDRVKAKKELEIRLANNQIIDVLSSVVESRDIESGNHIKRIKDVTRTLLLAVMEEAPEYGLDHRTIEVIVAASAMHDIGKIAIPDTILLKPGKLTSEEFEVMKEHALRGCEIINNTAVIQDKEYYEYCYDICRHHHERYNGAGYPDGLREDEISIAAQVVSMADMYDALISQRCYKDAYPEERVYRIIVEEEGGGFNPIVLACFKKVRAKLKAFYVSEAEQSQIS